MTIPTDTGPGIYTSTSGAIDAPGRRAGGFPAKSSGRRLADSDKMTRNARIGAMAGGTFISLWGLARGLRRGSIRTIGLAGIGAGLLFSAARSMKRATDVMLEATMTVSRPRAEIFKLWSNVENFPRFMRHLESVTRISDQRSRWVAANLKGNVRVEWEAEVVHLKQNEHIAWRSLPGADIFNAGMVSFRDAPTGRGTEMHVVIEYRPPAGAIGGAVARFLNRPLAEQLQGDLRSFKAMVETGEAPTTVGQSAGRSSGGSPWSRALSGGMELEQESTRGRSHREHRPGERTTRRTESRGVVNDTVERPVGTVSTRPDEEREWETERIRSAQATTFQRHSAPKEGSSTETSTTEPNVPVSRTQPGIPGVPGGSSSYGTEKSGLGPGRSATPQGPKPTESGKEGGR
jgi:uncharacterized membrane protein